MSETEDIAKKLRLWAEADVHETWRDGSLDHNDLLLWEHLMVEGAEEIDRLRARITELEKYKSDTEAMLKESTL